jgi:hypothetical protein
MRSWISVPVGRSGIRLGASFNVSRFIREPWRIGPGGALIVFAVWAVLALIGKYG